MVRAAHLGCGKQPRRAHGEVGALLVPVAVHVDLLHSVGNALLLQLAKSTHADTHTHTEAHNCTQYR